MRAALAAPEHRLGTASGRIPRAQTPQRRFLIHVLVSVLAGYEGLVFDIVLFIVSAFVAQLAGYWSLYMHFRKLWVLIIELCFVVAVICHVAFTVCPPHIPVLFEDVRGFYGMLELCYGLDFLAFKNTTPAHANMFVMKC